MSFEEPGDWPEVVQEYSRVREEQSRIGWTDEKRQIVDGRVRQHQALIAAEEARMADLLRAKRLATVAGGLVPCRVLSRSGYVGEINRTCGNDFSR